MESAFTHFQIVYIFVQEKKLQKSFCTFWRFENQDDLQATKRPWTKIEVNSAVVAAPFLPKEELFGWSCSADAE